ncbi:MAG TPA: N-methyl-D-aspartate receptor NMDAR2C subunit [Xanthomonadaceae bacterium]|jgi:predicted metal-dependent HD superfamily phosphohydrolase
MNLGRWQALLHSLDLREDAATFHALETAYREPHRHYHCERHIDDCLEQLDALRAQAGQPGAIELALWFHDAVYQPYRSGNEERSAGWASRFLAESGADGALSARVRELILATRHEAIATDPDTAILIDVDLSILGAGRERYDAFESDVRAEYRWVPRPLYRRERRRILESFLHRERIFLTDDFHERYESSARDNLKRAIGALA